MNTPQPFKKPIFVTKPFLPPFEEFNQGMKEIWDSHWLTNNGPILRRFEEILSRYHKTDNLCVFNNGTMALQIGIHGMGISGEVITTPFSFVATTHALYWNKICPVFVDIEPDYYTVDPAAVEAAITPRTTAILAVHVYGFPCKLQSLADIARRHNLVLIYDAAHAFGVTIHGEPISSFGDMSAFSFHATKLFHSIEGGMLIFKDSGLKNTFDYLKNFGIKNEVEVIMPGLNAKMNEFQALMGILVMQYLDDLIEHSRKVDITYRECLQDVPGIKFPPKLHETVAYNYNYEPVEIVENEFGMNRNMLYETIKKYNINLRRYFYPLLCDFSCYKHIEFKDPLTVARQIATKIICLPTYKDLEVDDVIHICEIIAFLHKHSKFQ